MSWYQFRPYVSVGQRRAQAAKLTAKLQKSGRSIKPIQIEGRAIATTFWGKAWCEHLESYSDFENRLPRGRTYVHNGSVIDLQITPGQITALVSGSEVYDITIKIAKLDPKRWKTIAAQCAGHVGSVLELLQGRFDKSVMTILTDRKKGLFPAPSEISMKCSCPDWAGMCKHLAAVLYGVGSRLDHEPELLFVLRQVDPMELIEHVATAGSLTSAAAGSPKTLADDELADVFGIELASTPTPAGKTKPAAAAAKGTKAAARSPRAAVKTAPVSKPTRGPKSSSKPAAQKSATKTPAKSAKAAGTSKVLATSSKSRKAPPKPAGRKKLPPK